MKIFFTLLVFLSAAYGAKAQVIKKYNISNSGCSAYLYCPAKFDISRSPDSSVVYLGECVNAEVTYGVICVKLLNPITDLNNAEDLLIQYLDFLKTNFEITQSAGYGKGHLLNNDEKTRGILDYWGDLNKNSWKVKGWTDGKFIGFLYAYSKKPLNETKINVFLDGFRFAGM
jgi:hypothetical protein